MVIVRKIKLASQVRTGFMTEADKEATNRVMAMGRLQNNPTKKITKTIAVTTLIPPYSPHAKTGAGAF